MENHPPSGSGLTEVKVYVVSKSTIPAGSRGGRRAGDRASGAPNARAARGIPVADVRSAHSAADDSQAADAELAAVRPALPGVHVAGFRVRAALFRHGAGGWQSGAAGECDLAGLFLQPAIWE